jgi:hypothetical protein
MMQTLLTDVADRVGRETGFIQRERKLTGASFVQGLVFGWLAKGNSTMEELSQAVANSSQVAISRQGLEQRFTARAAFFMEQMVGEAAKRVVRGPRVESVLLGHFNGVYLLDSSVLVLPDELAAVWAGCEGSAVKLAVCWELQQGGLEQITLCPGRDHDQRTPLQDFRLPTGSLRLADLGFFDLEVLDRLQNEGSYWIVRYKGGTVVANEQGQPLDLVAYLNHLQPNTGQVTVQLGQKHALPCRLIVERVPDTVLQQRRAALRDWERRHQQTASPERYALCAWTLLLTNVPADWLSPGQVRRLYALRWQIELLFKLWKNVGWLDEWNTTNPWRVLCELYAKLLALLLQHACCLLGSIHDLSKSFVQAAHTVAKKAWHLAAVLSDFDALCLALRQLVFCLQTGCRISRSVSSMPSFQSLEP